MEKLEDETDLAPAEPGPRGLVETFEGRAPDRHRPTGGHVDAGGQVQQRGLAAAATADDGYRLA